MERMEDAAPFRMCPYVAVWCGGEDGSTLADPEIKDNALVLIVPMPDGASSAMMRLGHPRMQIEPGLWSNVLVAMVTRRRPNAACIACEDVERPGFMFEWLMNELWSAMKSRGSMRPMQDARDDEIDVQAACVWLIARAAMHRRSLLAGADP
jgi:hypothetical protein